MLKNKPRPRQDEDDKRKADKAKKRQDKDKTKTRKDKTRLHRNNARKTPTTVRTTEGLTKNQQAPPDNRDYNTKAERLRGRSLAVDGLPPVPSYYVFCYSLPYTRIKNEKYSVQ